MSDPASYGDTWAPGYDDVHANHDPADAVAMLAELAGTGKALELGIGTGRVAIPLAAPASRWMASRLRKRCSIACAPSRVVLTFP